jgi:hypothetical protein
MVTRSDEKRKKNTMINQREWKFGMKYVRFVIFLREKEVFVGPGSRVGASHSFRNSLALFISA